MSQVRRSSFVVRVAQSRRGQVSGVIGRVANGAKETFTHMEAIGQVIAGMLQGEQPLPRAGHHTRDEPSGGTVAVFCYVAVERRAGSCVVRGVAGEPRVLLVGERFAVQRNTKRGHVIWSATYS